MKALEDALKASDAKVSAVSVKLPTFWPDKVKLWFAQAEAQFLLRNITVDKTKYEHMITMLDSKTAELAMDIIGNPSDKDAYRALKTRLNCAFALSDDKKAKRILNMDELGDRTPSQCLSNMLTLVPEGQDPGFLFRRIFLRQLPTKVRTHLAQSTKIETNAASLRELASEADKYFASMGSRISSISEAHYNLEDPNVNTVSRRQVCYYHAKFGDKATKCQKPCSFKSTSRSSATSKSTIKQGNFRHGQRFSN